MLFGKRKRHVKRIMIVEDEPLVAFDNETMLADAGYDVVATVDRYADAVAALDRESVDLILTDIGLTGERTGVDLACEARKRGIPVLFVTGHVPDNAAELAVGCLTKPYTGRTLKMALECVDRHLGGDLKIKPPSGLLLYPRSSG